MQHDSDPNYDRANITCLGSNHLSPCDSGKNNDLKPHYFLSFLFLNRSSDMVGYMATTPIQAGHELICTGSGVVLKDIE